MLLLLRRHVFSNIPSRVGLRSSHWLKSPSQSLTGLRWQSTTCPQANESEGPAVTQANENEGPAVTQTNRAEATMKRFWKKVDIEKRGDSVVVTLDARPLKTPSGKPLLVPSTKDLLATLIAAEWDHQTSVIKPHALPMTSLASRAIDGLSDASTRAQVQEALLNYLDTDTICFYEDSTPQLERLQAEHWDPLFKWVEKTFEVQLNKNTSILITEQPQETREKLGSVLKNFDQWQMAAMERATYTTKSFIIALALVFRSVTPEQAALAASVEVNSQIERWGEVEDTHDVDYHDVRRHLASAASLLCGPSKVA